MSRLAGGKRPEPGTLIYLCYGDAATYDQTVFSIRSAFLLSTHRPRIAVYCDRPEPFAALDVETVTIDQAQLDLWLGGSNYIHRRKTCVVLDALDRFEKIAFLDADTYLIRPPERLWSRIGPGRACFHLREGYVESTGTPPDRALDVQLGSHLYRDRSGKPLSFPTPKTMWNTGVVGIHRHDRVLVDEALHLSDAIWQDADPVGAYGKKIHHAEQFAMGHALGGLSLRETADLVYHYWPKVQKQAFAAEAGPALAAGVEGRALYALRPRERGWRGLADQGKMAMRRVAIDLGIQVPGVRRSVV